MKALRAAATVVAFAICGLGNAAFAATPDPDFGTPPSGEVPILYNDHTVYAKPDTLHKSRVLAAFVKGGEVYVPLRSMFEQMGATVTASDDGKTFTAQKPGVTVSVRLGSSVVTINGEERPLDVPPMMYRGAVLVPVRVISEALGAYVLWVPDKRVVVVRYIPIAPPPPTEAPTPPPTSRLASASFDLVGSGPAMSPSRIARSSIALRRAWSMASSRATAVRKRRPFRPPTRHSM